MAREKKLVHKVQMTENKRNINHQLLEDEDHRIGYKSKRINSSYGSIDIQVPQDRMSTFETQVVKKRQKDISEIDQKIISMYAKGMTTQQISDTLQDIYGFEASEGFISDVIDKILPKIEDCQKQQMHCPVVFRNKVILKMHIRKWRCGQKVGHPKGSERS